MRKQIPFDKYEAALLIEAVVRVEKGELLRQKAVEELSVALRRRALDKGIQISESFRSVACISTQLSLVSQLLYGKVSQSLFGRYGDSYRRTKTFDKMVDMFHSNRPEFDAVLRDAKDSSVVMAKKQFVQRLTKKVPSRRVKQYLSSLEIVDRFVRTKNLCGQSIFTLVDSADINKIMKAVASNRAHLCLSKKRMRVVREAVRLLGEFVRGRYDQTIAAMPKTTVASAKIETIVTPQVLNVFSNYEPRSAQRNGRKTLTSMAKIANSRANQNANEILSNIYALALETIEKSAGRRGFSQLSRTIQLNKDMPTVNFDLFINN